MARQTRSQAESILADMLIGVFEAVCDLCGETSEIQCFDSAEAAMVFYDNGWRGDESQETLRCRKCRRKK